MKKYRFFFHYNRHYKKMSVHFKGKCNIVSDVECKAACETKWSNMQPNLIMRGFAHNVNITNNKAIIT